MENTLTYNGEELKWEYKIVPCLECPIYPLRDEWKDDPDIRKDKCYTSRCTYSRALAKAVAEEFYSMLHSKTED